VAVSGNSPQHEVKGLVGVDKPKVTYGSDTYALDVSAALTADKKGLTVSIVNPTESVQQMDIAVQGVSLQPKGRALAYSWFCNQRQE
jgi:alpha-N-arabinofuranosidase